MAARAPVARTIVKVCGLTTLEDARSAVEAGADWLGFVLRWESPRQVEPEVAATMVAALPQAISIAVMVGPSPEEALALARAIGARRVQLHRVDPARWPADFPLPVTFAVPVDAQGRLGTAPPAARDLLLLDTADALRAGGTGRTFPWEAAAALAALRPVMLAGGLGPDNVAEAIARVKPFGVDASSRLETSPGRKDAELVRRFVAAAREADTRQGAA